ncbi:MAG: DUF4391 domain-containing protein [Eubacteriales bacterium]|nr:DUF4391 domain-containing protein [Eubacteriales bacterium]
MLGLPKSTECQQILPKKVIYAKNELNTASKAKLDADIKRVTIVNMVSPSNVAVTAGETVKSFCVALVALKQEQFDEKNIVLLTKLVKQNMLMILEYGGKAKLAAYHTKLLLTARTDLEALSVQLDGLNLDDIWKNILIQIGNVEVAEGKTLAEQIELDAQRDRLRSQIERLKSQAFKEAQPKKKFDLVSEAQKLEKELNALT